MRELRMSGSVGAPGERSPGATRHSFVGLESLITKYFADHNALIPRVALGGRTPDEAYFGHAVRLAERLRAGHAEARTQRVAINRAVSCRRCAPPQHAPPGSHLSIVR